MRIYIRAMSEERQEIRRGLVNTSDQIVLHLVKLMLFSDTEYVHHWMQEIYAFLHRIKKVKGKNKFPDYKFIKEALSTNNDVIPSIISEAKTVEPELTPNTTSVSSIEAAVEFYIDWISTELSTGGYVELDDVVGILEEMLKKYL